MKNNETTPENKCRERGSQLLDAYNNSKVESVHELLMNGGNLKKGDIMFRKLDGFVSTRSIGKYTNGSYSGPTLYSSRGIFNQFAIYYRSIGDDKHELIEKCDTKDDSGTHIWISVFTTDELKQHFKILVDCRYEATCDMALKIRSEKLDVGYSSSHSNCEHFVTFCLTRHGSCTRSLQAGVVALIRDMGAYLRFLLIGGGKYVSHPIYWFKDGKMKLDSRLLKTTLPFRLDSDEIVDGIKNGSKVFIGGCSRNIPQPWFPHDE